MKRDSGLSFFRGNDRGRPPLLEMVTNKRKMFGSDDGPQKSRDFLWLCIDVDNLNAIPYTLNNIHVQILTT